MNKSIFLALILFVAACSEPKFEGTNYGELVTLTERTEISEILANPESFLGERVLVEGTVLEVCTEMGCWMDIAAADSTQKIQIKVDDGVIVFPVSARGKKALVEGVVEDLQQTTMEAFNHAKMMAEEKGEAFDSTAVYAPIKTYRIRGKGAVIAE